MDDDDGDVVRQLDRLDLERAAIDQERAVRAACDGGQLIHDPAGHAGRELLGAPAGEGELVGASSRSATSHNASASATSSAADDESPEPTGIVDETSASIPTSARPLG